jgi:uncharacterized membrane protein YfcA
MAISDHVACVRTPFMTPEPLALLLGIGIGLVLGLTGAGGGVLAVPALVLALGYALPAAAPVALFAVGSAAAIGAYHGWRRREVRYRAAMVMACAGAVTAPLGISLAASSDKRLLTLLFCAVMLIVALRMLRATFGREAAADVQSASATPCRINPATGQLRWTARCALTIALIGACTGFCTGLLGVGGGFIIVPALSRVSDIKTHQIIATSLLAIALIAAFSVVSALWHGVVFGSTAQYFIGGSIAGMLLGRALIGHLSARWLMRGFCAMMLIVAIFLAKSVLD